MQATINYSEINEITDGISRSISRYKSFSNFSFTGLFETRGKKALNKTLNCIKELEVVLENIKDLKKETVVYLYENSKKIAETFDRIHDDAQSKNYSGDDEYENLFKSISRKLHKIENTSRKYALKYDAFEKTPDYIKQGLANYSNESMLKQITK